MYRWFQYKQWFFQNINLNVFPDIVYPPCNINSSITFFSSSYECLDSTQLVGHLKNQSFSLSQVTFECLYNGQWSYDIKEFGCTECER